MGFPSIKEKTLVTWINIFCIGQFIVLFILTFIYKNWNAKLILLISIVFGIMVTSVARNLHISAQVEESTKPLDEETFRANDR